MYWSDGLTLLPMSVIWHMRTHVSDWHDTAFYPHITLSGSGGLESAALGSLFNAPSLFWSLGGDALAAYFSRWAESRKSRGSPGDL